MAAKQKELYLRSQIDPDDTGDTPSGQPKRIRDKIKAIELNFKHENNREKVSNKQAEIDRQIKLAMQIREEEEELQRIKETSKKKLVEQKKQKERLQKEKSDMEKVIQV